MKPILYSSTETEFTSHGIGILSDAILCQVTEERNGSYELYMQYPITGIHFGDIAQRSLILAKTSVSQTQQSEYQPFRVYRITKPIGGVCEIYAEHISYDLSGIVVYPFSASTVTAAMAGLTSYSTSSYTTWTDKSTSASFSVTAPTSFRSALGGTEGSILDAYGGELEFDRFTVKLHGARGSNRGMTIRYGKNLTDLTQEEQCANMYTGVLAFYLAEDGTCTYGTVQSTGTYSYVRTKILDVTSSFDTTPTVAQLNAKATAYISANNLTVPKVSIDVSFAQLAQCAEYADQAMAERVELCDTVTVYFEALGVNATAKINKVVFDVLLDRFDTISLGDAQTSITDTIANQQDEINNVDISGITSQVTAAAQRAAKLITGNEGGYVVMRDTDADNKPNEILILDADSGGVIANSQHIWRWNSSGLGYSDDYGSTYGLAMTADGEIVADFITSGTMSANIIKAGLLSNLTQTNCVTTLDMDTGKLTFLFKKTSYNIRIEIWAAGITFYKIDTSTQTETNLGSFYVSSTQNTYVQSHNVQVWKNSLTFVESGVNESTGYGGYVRVNNLSGSERGVFYVTGGAGRLDLKNSNGTVIASLMNKSNNSGQLQLCNSNGICTVSLTNNSYGQGELYMGAGSGTYRMLYYDGERNAEADHFHFIGKSDGLVYNGALSTSDCSAYIVVGEPTEGSGLYETIVIPSAIATTYDWRIADATNWIDFSIGSDGGIDKLSSSSSNSGGLYGIHSIR